MWGKDKNRLYCNSHVIYNYGSNTFIYTPSVIKMFGNYFDDRPMWQIMSEESIASFSSCEEFRDILNRMSDDSFSENSVFTELNMKTSDDQYKKINVVFTRNSAEKSISMFFNCIGAIPMRMKDELTGLLTRKVFTSELDNLLTVDKYKNSGDFIVVYLDIIRFKMVNDIFGSQTGDRLLKHVADIIQSSAINYGLGCRIESDRFLFYTRCPEDQLDSFISTLLNKITSFELSFEIMCNAGIYRITESTLNAETAIDRAVIAQKSIKGSYTTRFKLFVENLRKDLVTEQEISGLMKTALKKEQFVVYYQPQYNHSTGMIIGAEALVRWKHPEKGIISPGVFIPIFEKNGFITELDMYVFEKACIFLKKCMQSGLHIIPVSINLTRYDIFSPDFIENLEVIRARHNVPSRFIRVEITESAALGNSDFINDAVRKLHSFGYIVEMDDFGSGYSSLNILKDIDFDIIKLDMKFMQETASENKRGLTILSSIIRMVNWLNLPIIAEGVETLDQADMLESFGCYYIQGYYYSKPLPEDEYEALLKNSVVGTALSDNTISDQVQAIDFWNNDSIETLIFNNFVGGAAVFEYKNGSIEITRINRKYLEEVSMMISEKELIKSEAMSYFDKENTEIYMNTVKRVIETGSEQECETWRVYKSPCCGEEKILIRSTIQLIGKSGDIYRLYARIKNITALRSDYKALKENEQSFRNAFEQIDVYMWEYNIHTREMKPCYRCQKNLGLPPVINNYPDPLFESGLFPQDYSEMYYDWMKQLSEGVESLEGVIPLTPDRIPFIVRYTTKFDETGNPVKAYGSAARVIGQAD